MAFQAKRHICMSKLKMSRLFGKEKQTKQTKRSNELIIHEVACTTYAKGYDIPKFKLDLRMYRPSPLLRPVGCRGEGSLVPLAPMLWAMCVVREPIPTWLPPQAQPADVWHLFIYLFIYFYLFFKSATGNPQ